MTQRAFGAGLGNLVGLDDVLHGDESSPAAEAAKADRQEGVAATRSRRSVRAVLRGLLAEAT